MSNIKKEKHFLDGLIDTYHSSIDIKQELQVQPSPDAYKGHFINALTLASTHFMDMQPLPNARELWPQSHSSAQQVWKNIFEIKQWHNDNWLFSFYILLQLIWYAESRIFTS